MSDNPLALPLLAAGDELLPLLGDQFEPTAPFVPKVMARLKLGDGTLMVWSDESFTQGVCLELSDKIPLESLSHQLAQDILVAATLELITATPLAFESITTKPPPIPEDCLWLKSSKLLPAATGVAPGASLEANLGAVLRLAVKPDERAITNLAEVAPAPAATSGFDPKLRVRVNEGEAPLSFKELLTLKKGDFVLYQQFARPRFVVGGVCFSDGKLAPHSPPPALVLETARSQVALARLGNLESLASENPKTESPITSSPRNANQNTANPRNANQAAESPETENQTPDAPPPHRHLRPLLTLAGEPVFEGEIHLLGGRKAFYITRQLPTLRISPHPNN